MDGNHRRRLCFVQQVKKNFRRRLALLKKLLVHGRKRRPAKGRAGDVVKAGDANLFWNWDFMLGAKVNRGKGHVVVQGENRVKVKRVLFLPILFKKGHRAFIGKVSADNAPLVKAQALGIQVFRNDFGALNGFHGTGKVSQKAKLFSPVVHDKIVKNAFYSALGVANNAWNSMKFRSNAHHRNVGKTSYKTFQLFFGSVVAQNSRAYDQAVDIPYIAETRERFLVKVKRPVGKVKLAHAEHKKRGLFLFANRENSVYNFLDVIGIGVIQH